MTAKPLPREFADDSLDTPFWEAAARHELVFQRCGACGWSDWPASACPDHGPAEMTWVPSEGRGEVQTYTVFHRAFHPGWAADLPYVVAFVALDEGPLMVTNVVGGPPAEVRCGMRVEVLFDEVAPGAVIPRFRPASP